MRRGLAIGIAAAAAAVAVVVIVLVVRDERTTADDDGPQHYDEAWQEVAPSPLSARAGAKAVWTGEEVFVLGGASTEVCPGCEPPEPGDRAFAAYDPAADQWRLLADVPQGVGGYRSQLAAAGGQVFAHVVRGREGRLFRYDPAADRWDSLELPRLVDLTLVEGGDRLLAVRRCACRDDPPEEHVLDPATGRWAPLPPDPFPELGDPTTVVAEGTTYRFARDPSRPEPASVAALRPGARRWEVLDPTGRAEVGYEPEVVGDLIVFAEQPLSIDTPETFPPVTFAYDTRAEAWIDLPELTEPMTSGTTASDGDTLWFGDQVLDADTRAWSDGAHVPEAARYAALVWIGDRWFAFGGQTPVGMTRRAYTWVPPG